MALAQPVQDGAVDNGLVTFWQTKIKRKPKCIVFDLDYTLWPFILDQHIFLPFQVKTDSNERKCVYDSQKTLVKPYQHVSSILATLKHLNESIDEETESERVRLAIASRSTAKDAADELMGLFGWTGVFDSIQIFSGNKQNHLKNIQRYLQVDFEQILFFDDNKMNLKHTSTLGITGYQLHRKDGLSIPEFKSGLLLFNKNAPAT